MHFVWLNGLEVVVSREKTMGRQQIATGIPFARVEHTLDKVVTLKVK